MFKNKQKSCGHKSKTQKRQSFGTPLSTSCLIPVQGLNSDRIVQRAGGANPPVSQHAQGFGTITRRKGAQRGWSVRRGRPCASATPLPATSCRANTAIWSVSAPSLPLAHTLCPCVHLIALIRHQHLFRSVLFFPPPSAASLLPPPLPSLSNRTASQFKAASGALNSATAANSPGGGVQKSYGDTALSSLSMGGLLRD